MKITQKRIGKILSRMQANQPKNRFECRMYPDGTGAIYIDGQLSTINWNTKEQFFTHFTNLCESNEAYQPVTRARTRAAQKKS